MGNVLPFSTTAEEPIPFIDLTQQHREISAEVMSEVERVFTTQKFIMGDDVAQLEQDIANYCDARHAIGCNSGTDALVIALKALDIGPGDEVITTPFSFFATASCVHRVGAKTVFADIDPETYNLSPEAIENAITPRTRAIIPVHLFGQCCDMEPIWRIANRHGLAIIEDAAQAIGAEYQSRKTGVLGTIACFSFFPTKNLGGAGDGGMITTDDDALAARMKRLRVHGDVGVYEHVEVGMNSRLDALQAAVLKVKLRYLESWTTKRRHNAARYRQLFRTTGGVPANIQLPEEVSGCRHVFNQYTMRVTNGERDRLLKGLKAMQVGCAVYYPKPLHLQKCFDYLGYLPGDFPEAERASQEVLALPSYPELPAAHQERVVSAVQQLCASSSASPRNRAA